MSHGWRLVERTEKEIGYPISSRDDAAQRLDQVADGQIRELLAELLVFAERNERDAGWRRRRESEDQAKEAQDVEYLESMIEKALSGAYGPRSKQCAEQITNGGRDRSVATMTRLRAALRDIPGRISA